MAGLVESTVNRMLSDIDGGPAPPYALSPETALAAQYGVSRFTMRSALSYLERRRIVRRDGRTRLVVRRPKTSDVLETPEVNDALTARVADAIIERLQQPDYTSDIVNELTLAREFGCSRHLVRKVLVGLSQFGIVSPMPYRGWRRLAITADVLHELYELRVVLEAHAIRRIVKLPADAPVWGELAAYRTMFERYLQSGRRLPPKILIMEDKGFHEAMLNAASNRFLVRFHFACRFLINAGGLPLKAVQELFRNSLQDHIAIIDALDRRDALAAIQILERHVNRSLAIALERRGHRPDRI